MSKKITRITLLKAGMIFALVVIGARLFQLQIIKHDEYVAAAEGEHTRKYELLAERGEIYMMDGDDVVPVVMNERVWTIFVDPSYVGDEKKVRETLTEILGDKIFVDFDEVFKDKTRQYFEVAKEVTWGEVSKVNEASLKGVGQKETTKRVYPYGELASRTLGFVNANNVGYGAEGALNTRLQGENGLLKTVTDVNNIPLTIGDSNVEVPAVDGEDIVLTLDTNVQRAVEKALADGMERTGGTNASAIVMDPNSGRIYAIANLPNYNPEEYWKVDGVGAYQNVVLENPYEPASVMKAFTFAAGIEEGKMRPTDTYTNTGTTKVDDRTIKNVWKGMYGTITFQDALDFSLNTGSVEALRRFDGGKITKRGRELLYEYYHDRFGLGEKTGVELYEAAGTVIGPNEGYGLNVRYANMTFGQGMDVTMLQVATAFSALVNGGNYYTPTAIAGELVKGTLVEREVKIAKRTTISESTSRTMREMLITTRKSGSASRADKAGYAIGGKSGTAETYDAQGAYTSDTTIASYVGFGGATADLPEYVVMVRISGEGLSLQGGADAAPIFTDISNYMLEYLKIKPGA